MTGSFQRRISPLHLRHNGRAEDTALFPFGRLVKGHLIDGGTVGDGKGGVCPMGGCQCESRRGEQYEQEQTEQDPPADEIGDEQENAGTDQQAYP